LFVSSCINITGLLSVYFLVVTPPRYTGAEYCDQLLCLSVCLYVCLRAYLSNRWTDLHTKFLCRSSVAVVRSFGGGVAIRCVLPVLCMTSRLAVMGLMAMCGDTGAESDVYECIVIVCLVSKMTYNVSWDVKPHSVYPYLST